MEEEMRLFQLLLVAALWPAVAVAQKGEPYGLDSESFARLGGRALLDWQKLQPEILADVATIEECRVHKPCAPEAQELLDMVEHAKELKGYERISFVHNSVDKVIFYTPDSYQWGVTNTTDAGVAESEHWSPPLETFRSKRGDCEDYVIAKYVVLWMAGVPLTSMRWVFEQQFKDGTRDNLPEKHVVLAVRLEQTWFILDDGAAVEPIKGRTTLSKPLFVIKQDKLGPRTIAAARP
jgi:predicted transglutaminase-like cysteine proteinase